MGVRAIFKPYIPRADGKLRDWMNNYAIVVAGDPGAMFLTPADGAMLIDLARRYAAAYARSQSPATKGKPATAAKNRVRREVWSVVRAMSMRIKHNRGISESLKIELGIYPPNTSQSRIGKPKTKPTLEVMELQPGMHRLRYSDKKYPSRNAKPPGVVAMHVLVIVDDKPARDPNRIGRVVVATRHVFNVKFKEHEIGKIGTYFGRWVTERGLHGPWSRAESMGII